MVDALLNTSIWCAAACMRECACWLRRKRASFRGCCAAAAQDVYTLLVLDPGVSSDLLLRDLR